MTFRKLKVRFYGAENDSRELIVDGPLDGSLYWFEVLNSIYPLYEIIKEDLAD